MEGRSWVPSLASSWVSWLCSSSSLNFLLDFAFLLFGFNPNWIGFLSFSFWVGSFFSRSHFETDVKVFLSFRNKTTCRSYVSVFKWYVSVRGVQIFFFFFWPNPFFES